MLRRVPRGGLGAEPVALPRHQLVPLQQRLAAQDALNEYIQHLSSAVCAIPPGVPTPGRSLGAPLFP